MESINVLGTSDEVLTCEHCGRTDLKSTVAISIDDQPPVYFGSDCAATALKIGRAAIRKAARQADRAKANAAQIAASKLERAETQAWLAWLDSKGWDGVPDFKLWGGFSEARAAWRAEQK